MSTEICAQKKAIWAPTGPARNQHEAHERAEHNSVKNAQKTREK